MKVIKAALSFVKAAPVETLARANAIYAGLKDNPAYLNPPFDLALLRSGIDGLASAITEALDGGRKAIAERNRLLESVIKMLRQPAHYLEAASKDDVAVFLSSGFDVRPTGRTRTPPLPQFIRKIDPGDNSAQLVVSVAPIPNAHSYEVRWAPANTGGTEPIWTTHSVAKTTRPVTAGRSARQHSKF